MRLSTRPNGSAANTFLTASLGKNVGERGLSSALLGAVGVGTKPSDPRDSEWGSKAGGSRSPGARQNADSQVCWWEAGSGARQPVVWPPVMLAEPTAGEALV